MELMSLFRDFSQAAGPVAITALWQGALLAFGMALCLRFLPGMPAADRFRAWAGGFAAVLALPFLALLTTFHSATGATQINGNPGTARAWLELDPRWALGIGALWLAASLWRALDLAIHGWKLRMMWRSAEPVEFRDGDFEVCATREIDRPSVIGFFRPRVLIPAWLFDRLTPTELEQVILHEAEHLRRRDDWSNLLQKLALVIFPLNPALAWIERQLCHERELACDDAVVKATGKPRAYAACLASLAERGLEHRLGRSREALNLGAWRQRPELARRVHRLLKSVPGLNPVAARALLGAVGCGILFGSVEFARAPQLVAFVAPVISQSNTPDLVNIDRRATRAMQGYRAINAVAHVPSPAQVASIRDEQPRTATPQKHATNAKRAGADAARKIDVAANQFRGSDNAQPTHQLIVLTTFGQVLTVARGGTTTADYDLDEVVDPAVSAPAPAGWPVMQLILRVGPDQSNAAAGSAAGAAKSGASSDSISQPSNSQPAQPAVIPFRDGWLVFQL